MIVCICHRISNPDIGRRSRAGVGFEEIQFEIGVATQCSQCEGCARNVEAQCGARPTANIKLARNLWEGTSWQTSHNISQFSVHHS